MPDVPEINKAIQVAEVDVNSPDSESTMFKIGGVINYIRNHFTVYSGIEVFWPGLEAGIPPGYLIEDGRAVSRTTYANLFTAIGTLWGIGDGATTFNLPDRRGTSARMCDTTSRGTAGKDPDEATRTPLGTGTAAQPGSYQADQVTSHSHATPFPAGGSGFVYQSSGDSGDGTRTGLFGGNETRGKNTNGFWIIKT